MAKVKDNILRAHGVTVTLDTLRVDLSDGRSISMPLSWYPRLLQASTEERQAWRLVGKGVGIHWEGIDEDISVDALLSGRASGESQQSLKKWLSMHSKRKIG